MKFKDFISENHFKKGQKVKVANAKSYDSLAKSSEVHGEIAGQSMMVKGVEYYPVKVGTGSYNVEAKDYPNILITAGLNDPRVQYWEPAKWTAKLRATKTDSNTLLLKTNMGAGHGGASGRYEALKEYAFEYAFVLDKLLNNE